MKQCFAFDLAGFQQLLYELENRHDVPFLRLAKLGGQQDHRGEKPLRCIIEKLILPEICLVLPGHDDGLGDNLRVLFSLGFMGQGLCLFVQVCIFIYKVQKVEAVAFCGVPYARHEKEMAAAISDDKIGDGFIYQMFLYELNNHEYGYTGDSEETLDALDYTMEQVQADARLLHGFEKARKKILGRG